MVVLHPVRGPASTSGGGVSGICPGDLSGGGGPSYAVRAGRYVWHGARAAGLGMINWQ